ncbi:MAG: SUMF1/EgtB/PvdO family nonheme iron enzyme [Verrucomicrobiota bacterium]
MALCFFFAWGSPLSARDRVALLIANSAYSGHELPEAKARVEVLAKALEQAGFAVTVKENIEKDFRRELEAFVPTCPNGGVSLLYFCGYGSRFDRKLSRTIEKPDGTKEKEYYYEVDSGIRSIASRDPYRLEDIVRVYQQRSHARLNLLVLDCAYSDPKAKPGYQGLAPFDTEAWPGGMVCYAAPPGATLPAGTSSHLARSLARHLLKKDRALGDGMTAVQAEVGEQSGGEQELWYRFSTNRDATAQVMSSKKRNISTDTMPPGNPRPGDEWINNLGMVFSWCPPGSFRMGLPDASSPYTRDAAQVEVEISQGFWIGKYEVALGDYSRARYGREKPLRGPLGFIPLNLSNVPLTSISPHGADGFLKNLNKAASKAGEQPKGWSYRLPTEAEWEYACRAGSGARYAFGDSPKELARYANYADAELFRQDPDFHYSDRSSNDGTGKRPATIGSYEPNGWGIHDMHGNVNEICADRYVAELPGGKDPLVRVEKSETFVIRGGAWCSTAEYCEAGFRNTAVGKQASGKLAHIGLRVVLSNRRPPIK